MGRVSRRRKVANEIKDMLEAMEEDFVVEDELEEELPDEELMADEDIDEDEDIDIEALLADDDEDDIDEDDIDEDDDDIEAFFADDEEDIDEDEDIDIEAFLASEDEPGIEDSIQDTGIGGDPTVKEITDNGSEAAEEVEDDADVFPTNSEYVAKITKKLDVIASAIEKSGNKKLAHRVDTISDKLEQEYL